MRKNAGRLRMGVPRVRISFPIKIKTNNTKFYSETARVGLLRTSLRSGRRGTDSKRRNSTKTAGSASRPSHP
uniref:Uncharacterized protein n=1 Tax=Leptospira ellisii TaxID=2023197 RepID=A0A2N0B6V3_9LEPT|nr:hypothetical protein CH379_14465 [Leptospira ellisii]